MAAGMKSKISKAANGAAAGAALLSLKICALKSTFHSLLCHPAHIALNFTVHQRVACDISSTAQHQPLPRHAAATVAWRAAMTLSAAHLKNGENGGGEEKAAIGENGAFVACGENRR
jgi:hypothetical protein